ncbi:MAG: phytanoyl-CoA dioxygenase family protein [Planctomycetes bacterium]|nr:phytanoyl-CoA dioxygenase family protein [Planctomycetota bacterium]
MLTATKFDNGHFSAALKSTGKAVYEGALEALPYPEVFDVDAAIESMYTDGCCIVPGVLSRDEVAEFRARIDATGGDDSKYEVKGWCFNKHLVIDWTKDAYFLRYIDRPGLIDVMEAIMGEDCHVHEGNTWVTGPGRKMPLHVDHLPVQIPEELLRDPRIRVPIYFCPVMFALCDMTLDIGPTILVPGSHLSGRGPNNETEWNGMKPKAALLKAGDALAFRFDVWHGAGANTRKDHSRRYIMQLTYGHRQTMPSYPPMRYEGYFSTEVLETATPRQRRLLCGHAEKPKAY